MEGIEMKEADVKNLILQFKTFYDIVCKPTFVFEEENTNTIYELELNGVSLNILRQAIRIFEKL